MDSEPKVETKVPRAEKEFGQDSPLGLLCPSPFPNLFSLTSINYHAIILFKRHPITAYDLL
jgi:hypothetical protein